MSSRSRARPRERDCAAVGIRLPPVLACSLRRRVRKAMGAGGALQERVLHDAASPRSVQVTGMFRDPHVFRRLRKRWCRCCTWPPSSASGTPAADGGGVLDGDPPPGGGLPSAAGSTPPTSDELPQRAQGRLALRDMSGGVPLRRQGRTFLLLHRRRVGDLADDLRRHRLLQHNSFRRRLRVPAHPLPQR